MKKARKKGLDGRRFDALSAEDKERIYQEIDRMTPDEMEARSKPLTAAQRAKWVRATKKKMGRPKIGAGCQAISVTLEKGLLKRADACAKRHGLKRAQLIAKGLLRVIEEDSPRDAA
jgi:hypothetical protein